MSIDDNISAKEKELKEIEEMLKQKQMEAQRLKEEKRQNEEKEKERFEQFSAKVKDFNEFVIDVVAAESLHHAPALSMRWTEPMPPHVLMIVDGGTALPVYHCPSRRNWAFMDYTTGAVAWHLRAKPRVCIVGAGGGQAIGLALLHHSASVTALESNPQVIEAMTGALDDRGGSIYRAKGVRVVHQEPRGFFLSGEERFDVVHLPIGGGPEASGAQAAQEAYPYTVESFRAMLSRLSDTGMLCVTCPAETPPRAGLRVLDAVAEALRGINTTAPLVHNSPGMQEFN